MTKYHQLDAVTQRCIYCNASRRTLHDEPQECRRAMQPIDEPNYGPPPLLELIKHLKRKG